MHPGAIAGGLEPLPPRLERAGEDPGPGAARDAAADAPHVETLGGGDARKRSPPAPGDVCHRTPCPSPCLRIVRVDER